MHYRSIIFLCKLFFTLTKSNDEPGNLTDVSICKLSHLGLDYRGTIGKTESGVRCQAWAAKNPIHPVDPSYTDGKFSDFSKARAKNYCRNPSMDTAGPWCYTMARDNMYETCAIPLCIFTECRITGPGMEYGGVTKKSISGRKCLKWNKKRPRVRINNEIVSRDKFHNDFFPDESASYAKKNCRNPDADPGGPWCFIEIPQSKDVQKEYCDIPFCQVEICTILSKNFTKYSHYTRFPETLTNFSFGVKIWHPDDFLKASATLVLSLYALPLNRKDLHASGVGVEITISNTKSALTAGSTSKTEYEDTPGILKANEFTYFSLTWWHNIITLFVEGRKNPIFMADYKSKKTLMGHNMNQFFYYSVQGADVIWSLPFCDDGEQCDVHTTTHSEFHRYFPLRETVTGRDLNFYLRAVHSAYINLLVSPVLKYPRVTIMLQPSDNRTRIEFQEFEKGPTVTLKETVSENLLNYWIWKEFTLGVFIDELQLYLSTETGTFPVMEIKHELFKKLRWFSPSSVNSIAQWSFFCLPPQTAMPPAAYPPDCALNKKEPFYNGTQDITNSGEPCLPWAAGKLIPQDEIHELFNEDEKFEASNYCRDPKNKQKGTFCYIISNDVDDEKPVKKQYCRIRKCRSSDCKIAGTGNDYIGRLATTRSNRTCQHWMSPTQLKHLEWPANFTANTTSNTSPTVNLKTRSFKKLMKGDHSESELLHNLFSLNKLFNEMKCINKWKCFKEIYRSHYITKRNADLNNLTLFLDNDTFTNVSDSTSYSNMSLHPPDEEKVVKLAHDKHEKESIDVNVKENDVIDERTSKYDYPYLHEVPQKFLNETLFAEMDLKKIQNFCRNPSRDIAGSWCYTEDPLVSKDLCDVRDCDKIEECTILLQGDGKGRKLYILPPWKEAGLHGGLRFSAKQWNPDLVSGLVFELFPLKGTTTVKMEIGAKKNEKILLYYDNKIVKEKTMPHIINSGKWENFWLQMRIGEIVFGLEGVPTPLFEWKHPNASEAINPVFLTMSSLNGFPMGVHLKCDECHTEIATSKQWSKIFPIGLWMHEETHHRTLKLYLRGVGGIVIPLYLMPNHDEYYSIGIAETGSMISIYKHIFGLGSSLKTSYTSGFLITDKNWTIIEISFTERRLNITSNGTTLFSYKSKTPMLFYWFSVGAEDGKITWSANCEPMDIDGPPLDGGWSKWSSWTCTVTCGGGTGYRTRTCSNPRPNIFGRLCEGTPTSTGVCNDFECGDVSGETIDMIRDELRKNCTSLIVKLKDSVLISNNPKVLGKVSTESPDAYYEWTKNGVFINPEPGRLEFIDDDVIIHKAKVSDTGVYVCMFFRIKKQRIVLHVVTLVVTTRKYNVDTRATHSLTLSSGAIILGYVYVNLKQKWLLNGATYIDYGTTTLAAVEYEILKNINESHTGEWRCIIEQPDLRLKWTTNIIKVRVKKAPNFFTHIMEDQFTAPMFSWLKTDVNVAIALVVIVAFVIGVVAFGVFAYLKWGRLPQLTVKTKVKNRRFQK